jgi:predicted nucleic acid-binding protein
MSTTPSRRFRLFLDANILISAAWKEDSKVARLWNISNVELVTSNYVVVECTRNLPSPEQQRRFDRFLQYVRVFEFEKVPALEDPPELPPKDAHVLAAAVLARADFLVTGDRRHFGEWFGSTIAGLRVEQPSKFPEVLELD